jgi:phosphoglycerol transferase
LAAFCLIAARYKYIVFKDSQIDEIIFYFVNGLAGGKSDNLWSAVLQNLPLVFLLFGALLIPIFDKSISFINRIIAFCLKKIKSSRKLTLPFLRLRNQAIYSLSMFLIATVLLIQSFGIPNYIYALTQSTKLYEENYVNPKTAR